VPEEIPGCGAQPTRIDFPSRLRHARAVPTAGAAMHERTWLGGVIGDTARGPEGVTIG
jgi:hypothetical protein